MTESASQWGQAFERGTITAMKAYDRIVAQIFEPWARDIVERLSPEQGSSVLDIACGPGTVTLLLAEAVGPAGHVIATDISPSMLAIGRAKPASGGPIEWIESPAAPLQVETDSVEGIVCQQGLQFFPDKTAALAEMRRTLVPGGRAMVSMWTVAEEQDFFGDVQASVASAWSAELGERYKGPFLMTGEEGVERAQAAGFANIELERVTLPVRLEGGAPALFDSLPASGIAADFATLNDEGRARLLEELTRRTRRLDHNGALHGTMTSSMLTLS